MSKIVDFRQKIIDGVKELYPEMDVEWYDGLFDEQDIADWTLKTPCARVAVMNVPTEHTMTGEMNAQLRCVVAIIDENKMASLDGDARAWDYVEGIAVWANMNGFGHPDAAPATKIKFKRISQPVLRREGVSVGVVEWESDLMIGRNKVFEHEYIYYQGQRVTQLPQTTVTARGNVHNAAGLVDDNDTMNVTPEVP